MKRKTTQEVVVSHFMGASFIVTRDLMNMLEIQHHYMVYQVMHYAGVQPVKLLNRHLISTGDLKKIAGYLASKGYRLYHVKKNSIHATRYNTPVKRKKRKAACEEILILG
jgi:hypothetical protein